MTEQTDLTTKIERAKALLAPALTPGADLRMPAQKDEEATEMVAIGLDLAAAVILDVRRIADALTKIAAAGGQMAGKPDAPGFRSLASGKS